MKKSFKRLVIDSATPQLYIALMEGNQVLEKYCEKGNNDHSVHLMPTIEKIFDNQQLTVDDLDEIILGIGPGSYTGVRIGVSVAKVFAWTKNIPVKTVSTLALLASSSQSDGYVLAQIDARRNNAFMGLFKLENNVLSVVKKEVFSNKNSVYASLPKETMIVENGEPNIEVILQSDVLKSIDNVHSISPNYLRKTEAERDK
jgi:tRNA threonylcarbamoyladenosine biosynthesis protein TsaB